MAGMGDYDLSRLRDSRILYLRNPPRFMAIAVLIVAAILIGALIWSCTAVKAEEVENRASWSMRTAISCRPRSPVPFRAS